MPSPENTPTAIPRNPQSVSPTTTTVPECPQSAVLYWLPATAYNGLDLLAVLARLKVAREVAHLLLGIPYCANCLSVALKHAPSLVCKLSSTRRWEGHQEENRCQLFF